MTYYPRKWACERDDAARRLAHVLPWSGNTSPDFIWHATVQDYRHGEKVAMEETEGVEDVGPNV